MAAAKLVTRCPACRTAFRLVADQLRLRQGLVRCGQCDTVFDAREHLIEVPASPSAAASPTAPATPPSAAITAALAHAEATQAAARAHATEAPFDPGYDPGYDVPALDSPTMLMSSTEAQVPATEATSEAVTGPQNRPLDAPAVELTLAGTDEGAAQDPAADTTAAAESPAANADAAALAGDGPTPSPTPSPAPWPTLDHGAFGEHGNMPAAPPQREPHVEPQAAQPSVVPSSGPTEPVVPAAAIIPSASYLRAADASVAPAATEETTIAGMHSAPMAFSDTAADTLSAVAREQATRRWVRHEEPKPPLFAPDFLRHTRKRPQTKTASRTSRRTWMWAAVIVLGIAALLQSAYLARSQLAGHFPMLRPALEAACAPLGCNVPPWRDIDALRIDTSQLQKQDEEDAYVLAITLRNQGRATTTLPAVELVMTDLQDQLLLRRVLQPADYLAPDQRAFAVHGLRAGTELPVRVRFRTQQAAANYRVLIFYP